MRRSAAALLIVGLVPAAAFAQTGRAERAAECRPPASTPRADTTPLQRYTARDGSFTVLLPASWRRDDQRSESGGVAAFGPPGEMLRVTFHKASTVRPAAEAYLKSRASLGHTMVMPPSHGGPASAAAQPLEVTVDRDVSLPEIGDVHTRERTAVTLAANGFIAVEEVSPRAGSCVPGLFERVRQSVTPGAGGGR